ncbi:tryptophan halogenase family protein [Mameliella sediminis]|uniref:tryptophan halogenase family protein n=1 Tax=Mameliella sediminis TaxID=2836866 RepID=UPI001C48E3E8|nr:tryptophan halogenase family protein [Mameliella sediminis]MBV7394505.1 tryptophan 7-halogenase [Mameliella sediminis]
MGNPVSSITVVGGGTAGWLAATFLRSKVSPKIKVTLIESPNIPTVGVGEATVPHMPVTLREMGIDDQDFMRRCNASFKMGVMFNNWNVDRKGRFISYMNPFSTPPRIDGVEVSQYFQAFGAGKRDFVQSYSPMVDLFEHWKGPFSLKGAENDPMPRAGYAYHLDAVKFAGLLAELGVARGVEHILDDVDDVELDDRGFVAALKLRETGRHAVQLVIDCTGFRGLIIQKALGEPFVDYSDYLGNDRAMAMPIPHPDPMKIRAATQSTALGAGWSWAVPLFNRIGTGYVFSSAHRTDEQAAEEFLAHLGDTAPKGAEPRVIPMRIGRSRRAWVKNCVALGLSGGFIEPLESTAIHMIDMGLRWLLEYFPSQDYEEPTRNAFNKVSDNLFNEVRDFICLHYRLGNRTDDPYWIDARTQLKISDRLDHLLDLWQYQLPTFQDVPFSYLFSHQVFTAVLLGKRSYETGYGADKLNHSFAMSEKLWKEFLRKSAARNRAVVEYKADHRRTLLFFRGELNKAAAPGAHLGEVTQGGAFEPVLF